MTPSISYPKRLIEVDLPIKKISEHARREKSIRHGHISTLHIWWARRPLAACRAVICAALWPDPADKNCPESFKNEAKRQMGQFWNTMDASARNVEDPVELRKALLDFIADFANWDNSTNERYLNTARKLTQSAHESLGGEPGTRPLVVDPFAGGGSIPLEALRVGADAYASDLNPVAVLLNKVVLEYLPKYGQELADDVRKWGQWVKKEAEKELAEYYPKDPDGSTPIAYLWARTITCEGPGCGCEVPLIRSLWLAKKGNRSIALKLIPNPTEKRVDFEIIHNVKPSDVKNGTIKRGATCPCCGYTTPSLSIRKQLKVVHGGADTARLFCVVTTKSSEQGRFYRLPTKRDFDAIQKAKGTLEKWKHEWNGELSLVPDEAYPDETASGALSSSVLYGPTHWGDLFTSRQALCLATLSKITRNIHSNENEKAAAIRLLLGFAVDKQADLGNSLCRWEPNAQCPRQLFGRQAIPMTWDFAEGVPLGESSGSYSVIIKGINGALAEIGYNWSIGHAEKSPAQSHPLPSDIASIIFTDPPYYDAIAYGNLSDFFYVILRRIVQQDFPELFLLNIVDKTDETVQLSKRYSGLYAHKTKEYFEQGMEAALSETRRVVIPSGIGIVVFAHKSTAGWEAQLQSMINAGWIITGSWPVDTECVSRMNAMGTATLASSIHLVCRPRENLEGHVCEEIGEWSDILSELPLRIREWMPRLKEENVVGADAIFACLGPALEIFSRYSRVEKSSGEQVTLKEYLEKVWEAVEQEALKMIFEGADATGFEEDARLTAMWLWTLKAGANGDSALMAPCEISNETDDEEDESTFSKPAKTAGYGLEYDAARKISQGLGAHPEEMPTLIEIKKGNARLLSVAERAPFLFGKQDLSSKKRVRKKEKQLTLFPGEAVEEEASSNGTLGELTSVGKTTLDRVHQSMLLFGNGQSEALRKFLVEDGVGADPQFKKLAQALVALYPAGSDEKRWAEGVMSRMKGLGL